MNCAIVFEDIKYGTKVGYKRETKEILHGLNGQFPAGSLIAILGPSGSGKTTLLNILSGCIKNYQGTVKINLDSNQGNSLRPRTRRSRFDEESLINDDSEGQQDETNSATNHATLSYIQQETHLCGLLTVQETFEMAAEFKIPANKDQTHRNAKIAELLNILSLDKVAGTKVCCISGGERKRISIALELLSDFAVILLDEPTTGLDCISTQICIDYLKTLALNGKTIVCTIHQPSAMILEKFDYLYVIADGYCLYQGDNSKMLKVLEEQNMGCPCFHNPADYIIEIATEDNDPDRTSIRTILIDRYHRRRNVPNSSNAKKFKLIQRNPDESHYAVSAYTQLKTLLKREYLKTIRNPTLTYLRLITSVTNSLILCAIFWKVGNDGAKVWFNYNAILGFVLHLMTPSLMLTILTFPTEYAILRRESINHWYSLKWYYAAITIIDLPVSIIYCLTSNLIFYYLTEQPLVLWRLCTFSLLGFLICIIAQSLGLLVGSLMNVVNGTFVGSALSFPLMMFAGFGVTFKDIPSYIQWVGHFSYLKYGVEGMAGSVMGYNRTQLPCPNDDYCHYKDAQRLLDDMGVQGHRIALDIYVLLGFFLFLRVLTYFCLRTRIFCQL